MTLSLLTRPDRLAALRRTDLLDTPPEEAFDRLTRMASRLLGTPVSLISLVADDHQFFKSATGLPEPWASRRSNPISFSFCGQVVATGEPLVLEDARRHPLLRHNPVIRELGWVAYAGVPVVTLQGHAIGALCAIDKTPRLWSERDIALLQDLAASVATEIELRTEIAERRHAEHGRRESEEQFHSSFEDSGIGMALISTDGRWVRVNWAVCGLLDVSREDLIGFSVEARTHPDDVSADREALRLLLAGEAKTYTMEKRYVRPSGQVVWTLVHVSLLSGPEGQPGHLLATIQDITERKHAEIALRESQERYRLLAKASKQAVWDWDLVTDRLVWDQGTGPLLDYQWSQLGDTASWWYERIHPADRERVLGSLDTTIAQGGDVWTEEYRFRRADESFAVVQDRAHIARDETGAPVRVVSANSGLSNAQPADRQLQQVLDALQVGVSVLDKQGRIVVANTSDRQLWGGGHDTGVQEVAEHRGWWADTGEPVRPEEWGALRAIGGEFSADEEVLIETADGQQKTIRSSATPLLDESGEIVGAVNVSQDVTEAKAEEATRARLEDQVHRTQKMEAIGRLAGGIAHDFNNLLTGILSYSDLILQALRSADPIRADVEQIKDAGQRAAHLTRQLLAFSRRQLLEPKVLSLNALVTDLEPMLGRLAGPSVVLETELDPALGTVLVDPSRLEQVMVNLVVNAREAMPAGGRVRISSANWKEGTAPGRGGGGAREDYVSLWVSDTGTGMDPATQSRIFEPFFSTKPPGSGVGLGLSTAYGIVEQSGGYITVDSAPGEGATFGLHFPTYVGTETPEPEARSVVAGKETLLLVEDETPVRESVRRLLEWHGYTVIEARNGADALEIYEGKQQGIDLVLTDLVMPGMGGHELVERLRARRPELPVVFMSGYADKAMMSNGAVGKGTAYVEKPFTVELLMQRLREVLEVRSEN
ncbi:MAG: PAS domain-containing protein [Gemmatimonadota bacterium]|nr:PAS domain-containing protein [Gemmatimonadota bacterium]